MHKFVPVILGIALLTVAALPQAEAQFIPFPLYPKDPPCPEASDEELKSKLEMLKVERSRHETNIQRMREELSRAAREGRQPDRKKLEPLADATGYRSNEYYKRPPYIQGLVDLFDPPKSETFNTPYNYWDAFDLAQKWARMGIDRAAYENEIERSEMFISNLGSESSRILGCLKNWAKRDNNQPECPSGAYLVACDPGMGGEPPFISDAMQPGQGFQEGSPWGSEHQPPTGLTEPGQPQPPTYTGTEPPPGAGPPGATGPQPPWYPPYQCGYPGYPPCPPGYSPPYDPTGRPPWEGLIPPSEPGKPKPPIGGPGPGGCPPGCHIKPGTNQCHCGGN